MRIAWRYTSNTPLGTRHIDRALLVEKAATDDVSTKPITHALRGPCRAKRLSAALGLRSGR